MVHYLAFLAANDFYISYPTSKQLLEKGFIRALKPRLTTDVGPACSATLWLHNLAE